MPKATINSLNQPARNEQNREHESQQSAEVQNNDTNTVPSMIPPRLLRKLKRIPRLADLEKMFDEPSSSEDNNYLSTLNSASWGQTPSNSQTLSSRNAEATITSSIVGASSSPDIVDLEQIPSPSFSLARIRRPSPPHTVTSNTAMGDNTASASTSHESPIDLTADSDDVEEIIPTNAQDATNSIRSNSDSADSARNSVCTTAPLSTASNDDAASHANQIFERIFDSLTQVRQSQISKPLPTNSDSTRNANLVFIERPSVIPVRDDARMEAEENQAQDNSDIDSDTTHSGTTAAEIFEINGVKVIRIHRWSDSNYTKHQSSGDHLNMAADNNSLQRSGSSHSIDADNSPSIPSGSNNDPQTRGRFPKQRVERILCTMIRNKSRKIIGNDGNAVLLRSILKLKQCLKSQNLRSTSPIDERHLGNCPICLDRLSRTSLASTLCGHLFCLRCIRTVLITSSKRCPTCRKPLKYNGFHQIYL